MVMHFRYFRTDEKITFSLDGTNRKMVPLPLPMSWKKSWFFSRENTLKDVASKNLISFVFWLICTTFKETRYFASISKKPIFHGLYYYSINSHVDLFKIAFLQVIVTSSKIAVPIKNGYSSWGLLLDTNANDHKRLCFFLFQIGVVVLLRTCDMPIAN